MSDEESEEEFPQSPLKVPDDDDDSSSLSSGTFDHLRDPVEVDNGYDTDLEIDDHGNKV